MITRLLKIKETSTFTSAEKQVIVHKEESLDSNHALFTGTILRVELDSLYKITARNLSKLHACRGRNKRGNSHS